MSDRSRLNGKRLRRGLALAAALSVSLPALPARADLADPAALAGRAGNSSDAAKASAAAFAGQARSRAADNNTDFGPLSKLWCEAALTDPQPESLGECAAARYGAVQQMSNPQPSREDVLKSRAAESLGMVRAALEIAGGREDIAPELRKRLAADASCLRALTGGGGDASDCRPPYDQR